MRLNLRVPFRDNYKVKRLGARWDIARRCWYVVDPEDVSPFLPYLPAHLTKPHKVREAA